jgi:hypothetical protein
MTLVDHFEAHLGAMTVGWARDADDVALPFQIARYQGQGDLSRICFATLGLGQYSLASPTSGRDTRLELLMLASNEVDATAVPALLTQVALTAIRTNRALLRGDVVGPAGPLVTGSKMEAFYVTSPAYFQPEFAVYHDTEGPIVVAWLVPISVSEADFVTRSGWDAFEDLLVEADPDLADMHRAPIRF